MTRVLAPSNVGYVKQEVPTVASIFLQNGVSQGTWSYSPTRLHSYRGPLTRSNGKYPTNYVRMISKLVPSGSVDCQNGQFLYKAGSAPTITLTAIPNGCSIPTGGVGCPTWMTDRVVMQAKNEMSFISANILEDLGQMRQTGTMIAKLVKAIFDGYLIARKGQWGKLRRHFGLYGVNVPRQAANGWLMYFYGIRPLVSTIKSICDSDESVFRVFKVRKRIENSVDGMLYSDPGAYWMKFAGKAVVQAQCQLEAKVSLKSNLRTWLDLGISDSPLNDAVVTAWALVPYSFVFDWFIPVEAWLRSLVWGSYLDYNVGFIGKRHFVEGTIRDDWPWSGQRYTGAIPEARLQVRFYKRETLPFVPLAGLSVALTLNPNQIISAAALITQRGA